MGICSCYFLVPEGAGFFDWMKTRDGKILARMIDEFMTDIESFEDREPAVEGLRSAMKTLVREFCKERSRSEVRMEVQAIALQRKTASPIIVETDFLKSRDGGLLRRIGKLPTEIVKTFY
jgi:hypothetical protein